MSAASLSPLRSQEHAHCVACGLHHPTGLRIQFHAADDGGVTATVDCTSALQGYAGLVHGGIISLMLDAAMTNCLFQRGVPALTAQLTVRFREPVQADRSAVVTARVVRETGNAFVVEGNVFQDNRLKAKGEGIFMRKNPDICCRMQW